MSFLAPLFLLGAAAVALPVIFHLIRRSSRDRVPFSSLMFLQPTPPRVTRRSKLENLFLLLLRCAVVGLLAFAFARPYFSRPVTPEGGGRTGQKVLLLVDTSASMRRGSLWSEAKAKAQAVLAAASPADQVSCFTFDAELHSLVTFDQWAAIASGDRSALVSKRLDEISPGWGSTRLGPALISACELFESAKDDPVPKKIVVISDLQEGSRLDGLQGFEWPRGIQIDLETLKVGATSNAGLQLAVQRENGTTASNDGALRVRVTNSSDAKREQFKLGWRQGDQSAFVGPTLDIYVPPGQSRLVAIPPLTNTNTDRLGLTGDDDEFDNTVYIVAPKAEQTRILFLGNDRETDPAQALYYVRRAFQETRSLTAEIVARPPDTVLAESDLSDLHLIIMTAPLPNEQIALVKRALEGGTGAVLTITDAAMANTVSRLLGQQESLAVEEAAGGSYAMLGQIDFAHPLFAPFADPRYSDFTKIHFWKHRRVALDTLPGARMLARFDTGDPALVEIPLGKGKLWVLTSGWQPADSQLALSSKFVPLLYAMLAQTGEATPPTTQSLVGDPVTIPATTEFVTVRKPDASEVRLKRGEKFTATDQPGIYTVTSAQAPVRFAVNLAPDESRTAPLPLEELERLGIPVQHQLKAPPPQLAQHREHLQAVQLESRQKLWRWLIVAALVVLVLETWLAGRMTGRMAPVT